MRCFIMFITAICLLFYFLLKLKWPKDKTIYKDPIKPVVNYHWFSRDNCRLKGARHV